MSGRPIAACLALALSAGCTLYNDTGSDPGQYWQFVCPDSPGSDGMPVPASVPISYVASGTCGSGGAFSLGVDGCDMVGDWSVLGLSDVETTAYTSSPGLGEWSVTAIGSDGMAWSCAATASGVSDLTFTCVFAATEAAACQSTLAPTP
jgi:hypothetical protein